MLQSAASTANLEFVKLRNERLYAGGRKGGKKVNMQQIQRRTTGEALEFEVVQEMAKRASAAGGRASLMGG